MASRATKAALGQVAVELDVESPSPCRARLEEREALPVDGDDVQQDVELILPIVAPVPELGDLGRQSLPPVTAAGQYYLFTVVRSAGPYAQPEDLGRQGLWDVLKAAYRKSLRTTTRATAALLMARWRESCTLPVLTLSSESHTYTLPARLARDTGGKPWKASSDWIFE